MLGLALAAAAGATAALAWIVDRRRCIRRNERGRCAACRARWAETRSGNPYLIHGRLVCEACGEKARARMPWQLAALVAAVVTATGWIVTVEGLVAMVLFPAATTALMALSAVHLMKNANRRAQRRIATGDSAEFKSAGTVERPNERWEVSMATFERAFRSGSSIVATCFMLTACGTGPERGSIQVVMTGGGTVSASVSAASSSAGPPGDVPIGSVESIALTIVRIDLKPADAPDDEATGEGDGTSEEAADESQWIRLPVAAETTVDLLTLPSVGGQEVGEGEVVATTYKEIRLVCDGLAMLTLAEPVTVSGGLVIGDDEPLEQPLRIPSCESSGLKIKGGTFNVPADGEGVATIEVSTDATVESIEWNSQGFRMSPVMKVKD